MYIPIMKNRVEEMRVAKELDYCFSEKIIPLFEIIDERYEDKYEINPITGEFIMEYKKGKKRRSRKKIPRTSNDIITLEFINNIIGGKVAFIDYYRYSYGNKKRKVDINKTMLSWNISNDYSLYIEKVLDIGKKHDNFIPVLSIKENFNINDTELEDCIKKMKMNSRVIAVRITDSLFEEKVELLNSLLDTSDYILYDIGKQRVRSKVMELEELEEYNIKSKIILLNCPRDEEKSNGEYEEAGKTNLIDNSAMELYSNYRFNGVGDYCGLKGIMPEPGGGNGTGCALALIYNYRDNSFYSFVNRNSSIGVKGYHEVINKINEYELILNPQKDCIVYKKVDEMKSSGSTGSFSTWVNITAKRYIYQIYKNKV